MATSFIDIFTFAGPLVGIRKGFCALMKFGVSANNDVDVLLLFSNDVDVLALSFVGVAAFVVVFFDDRFVGASVPFTVPCFCICLHFALLFLNQTFKSGK